MAIQDKVKAKRQAKRAISVMMFMVIALVMAFPFYWMVLGSLKTPQELFTFPPKLFVTNPQWINYQEAWNAIPMAQYLLNSTVMTLGIVFVQLITSCLAAYGYSKVKFFGRDLLFYLTIACLVVPPQVRFIPLYILFSKIGWLNTFWALIFPFAGSAFAIFFIRQTFLTINDAYIDAAKIEGSNVLQTIWHVMVPMSKTTLLTLSLFSFIFHWNDYFWPLVMTNTDAVRTLPVGLAFMFNTGEAFPPYHTTMAANLILVGPLLILFIFIQRNVIEALTFSPLK